MNLAELREERDRLAVHFVGAVLVGFATMTLQVWCAKQGFVAASVAALITFGLTFLYAILVWGRAFSVWLRIREARRTGA